MLGGSNSTLASNARSHFSDDHSISVSGCCCFQNLCDNFSIFKASFNAEDLNQEMVNLDNLMRDLNAMKPNQMESR